MCTYVIYTSLFMGLNLCSQSAGQGDHFTMDGEIKPPPHASLSFSFSWVNLLTITWVSCFHTQGRRGGREGAREETSGFQAGAIPESWLCLVRDCTTKVARVFQFHEWGKIQNLGPPPGSSLACFASSRKND